MPESLPTLKIETLLTVFKEIPPVKELTTKLEKASSACATMLQEFPIPTSDEEYEENNQVLVVVREQYGKMKSLREGITKQTDELKDYLMEFERPFDTTKKDNAYAKARLVQEQYQQQKLEKTRAEQALIAKRKELENHKVDLRAKIMENLTNNVTETIKRLDIYCTEFFRTLGFEEFDKKAEDFKRMNPKLKVETYDACFQVTFNANLIKPDEIAVFISEIKATETYEKWNTEVKTAVAPTLNEWRARIPEIKQKLVDLMNASAEQAEKIRKQDEIDEKLAAEKRLKDIETLAEAKKVDIQQTANMEKMGNEFAAQVGSQSLEDPGSVKLILKFTDAKTTPKALFEIMYHCFSSPEFPGIQKRDGKKQLMFDDKGRPIYIEAVQWWLDFFMKNCDAAIENTKVFEDSKITVRK